MTANPAEAAFQADILRELTDSGWVQGHPAAYDRERALYPNDCLTFVKTTQPKVWQKYKTLYPASSITSNTLSSVTSSPRNTTGRPG